MTSHWGRTAFESESQSAETARSTLGHKFSSLVMYSKKWLMLRTSIVYLMYYYWYKLFIKAIYVGSTQYLVAVAFLDFPPSAARPLLCSMYPGKWRFIGIANYKFNSPGGDCYWGGGISYNIHALCIISMKVQNEIAFTFQSVCTQYDKWIWVVFASNSSEDPFWKVNLGKTFAKAYDVYKRFGFLESSRVKFGFCRTFKTGGIHYILSAKVLSHRYRDRTWEI